MSSNFLRRTYVIRGLDRFLYSHAPAWQEGTFLQEEVDVGRLVLRKEGIISAGALKREVSLMDLRAQQFRLAVSKRTICPLSMKLERSEEPIFEEVGAANLQSAVKFSDELHVEIAPRDPPEGMEQLPQAAERWVTTLAETASFGDYPDEKLKRLYLLIEEFKDNHAPGWGAAELQLLEEIKLVRDFVSHPICKNKNVVDFIIAHLPQAGIQTSPRQVQFDRTSIEHRNFVGRYDPKASELALRMLNAEIAKLGRPSLASGIPGQP